MHVTDQSQEATTDDPPSPVAPVSATLAANETLERLRRAGTRVLPLAFGEAGIPVHPALEAELAAAAGLGGYGPVAGAADLRAAAAGYWARRGLPTDPEMMVAGPGSKSLLFALLLSLGGSVAVPRPSWVSYAAQAALVGNPAVFVPTSPGEGGVPNPSLLADAVVRARKDGRDVRAVVVTLPDNPTGTLAGEATVKRLCEVATEYDLVIISDEIYRDLVHDPSQKVVGPAKFAPERTVVSTALSKNLALGGWRLGVTRLPDSPIGHRLRARLLGIASEIWSSPPAPMQRAAAYAFAEPPELVERITLSARLHGTIARAVADRFTAAGASVPAPRGGFYIYPDLSPLGERIAEAHGVRGGAALSTLLLERHGIGVLAGSAFGEPAESLKLRVATSLLYGETDQQRLTALGADDPAALPWIAAALDLLSAALHDITGTADAGRPARASEPPAPAPDAVPAST